jgi:uncharacterized membrane protein
VKDPGDPRGSAPPATDPARKPPPIERVVRRVLFAGIVISVALMAFGLALAVAAGEALPRDVVPLTDLPRLLSELQPAAFLSLGLLVLIAPPFVRVAGSVIAFAREGDRRYAMVTSVVLVVMCLSVVIGKA